MSKLTGSRRGGSRTGYPPTRKAVFSRIMALEPRFMFDAAGAVTADAGAHPDATLPDVDHGAPAADPAFLDALAQSVPVAAGRPDVAPAPAAAVETSAAAASDASGGHTVMFVDATIADYQALVDGARPGVEVVVLDPARDGLVQMADYLNGRSGIDSIQIMAHGSSGRFALAGIDVNSDTLATHGAELAAIGRALTPDGDILIYACNTGAGLDGQAFVIDLAMATGADVAASSDNTGAAALGGNWVLETRAGAIEATVALTAQARDSYDALMTATFTQLTGTANIVSALGSVTSRTFIAADFDGDGDTDFIIRNNTASPTGVNFWRNSGGVFTLFSGAVSGNPFSGITWTGPNSAALAAGFSPFSMLAADIDGDGDIDVVNMASATARGIWLNNSGVFAFATGSPTLPTVSANTQSLAGDFDGDGDIDIIIRNNTGAPTGVNFWRNDGGTFTFVSSNASNNPFSSVTFAALAANFDARFMAAGDVDGDGDIDIINMTGSANPGRGIWLNNNGVFSIVSAAGTLPTASTAGQFVAGDFDGDGDTDIAFRNALCTGVDFYRASGGTYTLDSAGNPFSAIVFSPSGANNFNADYMALADFDSDGDLDIVNLTASTAGKGFFRNDLSPPQLTAVTVDGVTVSDADNPTDVGTTPTIILTFDKNIQSAGTGKIYIREYGTGTLVGTAVTATDTTKVSGVGSGSTITITPGVTLSSSTRYYIQIDKGAFFDSDGATLGRVDVINNSTMGLTAKDLFDFTTINNTAPTLDLNGTVNSGTGNSVTLAGAASGLADAAATVADTENDSANWNGATLTVARTATAGTVNGAWSSDQFGFTVASGITIDSGNLKSGATTIGTVTNTGGTLTVTFNSSASTALVTDVVKGVTYANSAPAGNATLTVTLTDGAGASTSADVLVTSSDIHVTATTDSATVDVTNGVSFSEAVAIAAAQSGTETLIMGSGFTGAMTLAGNLTLSESLTINADAANGWIIQDGTKTINLNTGTTLTFTNSSGTVTINPMLTGSGGLIKSGAGTLTLGGTNSYGGATSVTGGTLSIAAAGNIGAGAITLDGGMLASTGATVSLSNDVALGTGGGTVSVGSGNALTLSGTITGIGNILTKDGAGSLALSGTSNSTGWLTAVSDGTLSIAAATNIGTGSITLDGGTLESTGTTVSLSNGFTLGSGGGTVSVGSSNALTLSGTITGTGNTLTKGGAGSLTLSGTSNNTGWLTAVTGGTLSIAAASNIGTAAITLDGGTLESTGSTVSLSNNVALGTSGGTVSVGSGNALTLAGTISGTGNTLTKGGAGVLTLSGTSNNTGWLTSVTGGTLSVAAASNIGTGAITLDGGTLDSTGSTVSLSNGFTLGAGGGTVSVGSGNALTLAGVLSGSGALAKSLAGTLTLSGTNTYTGPTAVGGGTLVVTGTLNGSAAGTVSVNSGGTLAGTGTINGGVSVASGGTLSPGIAGTNSGIGALTIASGGLTIASGGTLAADIAGASSYDLVAVTGAVNVTGATLTLGGTHTVTTTTSGQSFVLITNDSTDAITGTFSGLAGGGTVSFNSVNLTASYAAGSNTNDFQLLGPVNQAPVLAGTFTTAGTVNDNATTTPFSGVTFTDANDSTGTFTVTITYTGANGTLSSSSGLTGTAGNYTLTASTPAAMQTLLQALVFTPTADQVTPGATVGTTFTLTPSDGVTAGTANATSVVTATSINDTPATPTLTGTSVSIFDAAGTTVGTLASTDADTGQTLTYTLVSGSGDTDNVKFSISGTTLSVVNPATLTAGTYSIRVRASDGTADSDAVLTITATGTLTVTINNDDAWNGTDTVAQAQASNGGLSLREALHFATSGATIKFDQTNWTGSGAAATTITLASDVTVAAGVTLDGNIGGTADSVTIAASGGAKITMGGALTLSGGTGDTLTVSTVLAGATSTLEKTGTGTLVLTGSNSFTGATTVSAGTMLVTGALAGGGTVSVASGATLGGTGSITTSGTGVTIASGAILAPGVAGTNNGIGKLTIDGNLQLSGGLAVQVGGSGGVAGTDFDQVAVNGTVSLNGGSISFSRVNSYVAANGAVFRVIDNDSTDAVGGTPGTFGSIAEGATTSSNGDYYSVSYSAGTGNDVTLISVANPTVSSVSATNTDGSYKAGDSIAITVTFTRPVTVTGTPTLSLGNGGTASYSDGSGTDTLTFTYTVQAGDTAADLDYASTTALSGTIADAASNAATLTLAAPGASGSLGASKAIVIDTAAPTVSSVSATNTDGTYTTGDSIAITIAFSEAVTVTGTPTLSLGTGRTASYISGSGTGTLTFTYTVQAGDGAADLDYASTTALSGTIADAAGNAATLTLATPGASGSLGANKDIVIDTGAPLVSAPVLSAGSDSGSSSSDGITNVTTPTFTGTAEIDSTVTLYGTDGTTVIGTGMADGSGNYSITVSPALSPGVYSITAKATDAGGNVSAASTSLSVTIDTVAPGTPSVPVLGAGSDSGGSNSDGITNVTAPTLTGTAEVGSTVTLYDTDGTTPVGTGTADGSGNYAIIVSPALSPGVHSITAKATDAAGNVSTASTGLSVTIDTGAPTVLSVSSTATNGSYKAGDGTPITVTFSEAVMVTGTPTLLLNTGQVASYSSGSGTNTLTFIYRIQAGDTTADLDYASTTSLSGTIADVAGNAATLTLAAPGADGSLGANKDIVIDTGAPMVSAPVLGAGSDSGSSSSDGITNVTTPTLTGTAEAGSTVTLYDGTAVIGTGKADGSGNYAITVSTLSPGVHSITATATDNGGNVSAASAGLSVTIDMTGPSVSSVSATNADGSYTTGDNITVTVAFSEAVLVTGTPTLSLGIGRTASYSGGSGTSTLSFTYTVQVGDSAADLDYASTTSLSGTIADAAGNAANLTLAPPGAGGSLGANKDIVIDTGPPLTPSAPMLNAGSDSGSSNSDGITNNTMPTFTGRAETGSTVTMYDTDGTTVIGAGTADGSGNYAITVSTLSPGVHSITAKAIDAGGNVSAASTSLSVTIDTGAPTVSSVSATNADGSYKAGDSITITVAFSEAVLVTGTPTLSLGTGRTASYSGGSGTSTLTFTYDVQAGDRTADLDYASTTSLSGTIADVAGNAATLTLATPGAGGSLGANKDITIDTTVPVVTSVSVPPDAVYRAGQTMDFTVTFSKMVSVDGMPVLPITLDNGEVVQAAYISGSGSTALTFRYIVGTGRLDTNGITLAAALSGGTIRDAAGNNAAGILNDVAGTGGVRIDSVLPTVSSVTAVTADGTYTAGDTITLQVLFSEAVTVSGVPTLTLNTGQTARYSGGSGTSTLTFIYDVQTGDNSADLDASGSGALSGSITDAAGNDALLTLPDPGAANSLGGDSNIVIDTMPPVVRSVTVPPDGLYKAGETLSLLVQVSETVTVRDGTPSILLDIGGVSRQAVYDAANSTGTVLRFDYVVQVGDSDLDGITVGALSLNGASIVDANRLALTGLANVPGTQAVRIDTVAPAAPASLALAAGSDSGSSGSDRVTNIDRPTFVGTAEPGATVTILIDGVRGGTATARSDGTWSFTPSTALANGVRTITTTATDAAGNTSPASAALVLTLDTQAPVLTVPGLGVGSDSGASASDRITNVTRPTLTGVAEAGSTVGIILDGTTIGTTTAGADGTWRFTIGTALAEGDHSVQATSTDLAGNIGRSASQTFTIRSTPPGTPSVPVLLAASDSGASAGDRLTNVTQPTVTGTAIANGTVTVLVDGTAIGTVQTDASGAWSLTPGTALSAGAHQVQVRVTDLAGNSSQNSDALVLTVDTAPPTIGAGPAPSSLSAGTTVVIGAGMTLSDTSTLDRLTVTLTNAQPGDELVTGTLPAGITATRDGSRIVLAGVASAADYQAALQTIGLRSSATDPAFGGTVSSRSITMSARDAAGNESTVATVTVPVSNAVTVPPPTTIPTPVSGNGPSTNTSSGTAGNTSTSVTGSGSSGAPSLPGDGLVSGGDTGRSVTLSSLGDSTAGSDVGRSVTLSSLGGSTASIDAGRTVTLSSLGGQGSDGSSSSSSGLSGGTGGGGASGGTSLDRTLGGALGTSGTAISRVPSDQVPVRNQGDPAAGEGQGGNRPQDQNQPQSQPEGQPDGTPADNPDGTPPPQQGRDSGDRAAAVPASPSAPGFAHQVARAHGGPAGASALLAALANHVLPGNRAA